MTPDEKVAEVVAKLDGKVYLGKVVKVLKGKSTVYLTDGGWTVVGAGEDYKLGQRVYEIEMKGGE